MKIAVIKSGGKQYKVAEKDKIMVEKLSADKKISFEEVLLIADENKLTLGKPFVKGSKVEAKVLGNKKDKKVRILKFKPKKRYRKLQGHRQELTEVEITKIS